MWNQINTQSCQKLLTVFVTLKCEFCNKIFETYLALTSCGISHILLIPVSNFRNIYLMMCVACATNLIFVRSWYI